MPISPRGATSVSRVLADRPSVSLICNFTNLHFGWNGPSATVNLRRTSNRTPHAFPSRSRKHSGICNSVMPGNRQGHSGLPAHPAQNYPHHIGNAVSPETWVGKFLRCHFCQSQGSIMGIGVRRHTEFTVLFSLRDSCGDLPHSEAPKVLKTQQDDGVRRSEG